MKTILSHSHNPYFNLAWEEYILKYIHTDEDIFLLWQNDTSIIVGRNQNVYEEVNLIYIDKNHIPLIRRMSGGGTVFHDLGNLNYSYITSSKGKVNNYQLLTKDIVDALNTLGVPAQFVEKSDIKIDGKKISGNAQFIYKDKLLHHGTLLIDTNLFQLSHALLPKTTAYAISVKSNRSLVVNLASYLNLSIDKLTDYLYSKILTNHTPILLTPDDLMKIKDIQMQKYQTYEWNYGQSPRSIIHKEKDGYQIRLTISNGIIEDALILKNNVTDVSLSASLVSKRYYPASLAFLLEVDALLYQQLFDQNN